MSSLILAGGLTLALLLAPFSASAMELIIRIKPNSHTEHTITVNGITKETISHEAIFDIDPGYVTVQIGNRSIKKFVSQPSLLEIYYDPSNS